MKTTQQDRDKIITIHRDTLIIAQAITDTEVSKHENATMKRRTQDYSARKSTRKPNKLTEHDCMFLFRDSNHLESLE